MTAKTLGEMLAEGATHPNASTIENWEKCYSAPGFENIGRLCEIFEVPALRFFAIDGITLPKQLVADVIECLSCDEADKALGMLLGALTMLGMAPFDANEIAPEKPDEESEQSAILKALKLDESVILEKPEGRYRVTRVEEGEPGIYRWEPLGSDTDAG
jgi:hypothetical protein